MSSTMRPTALNHMIISSRRPHANLRAMDAARHASGARTLSARSSRHVCLPPMGSVCLLDHLVRQDEERRGKRDPERLCRLAIEDQLKLHGLLDGEIRGLGALE